MEKLKRFDEIYEPDARQKIFAIFDQSLNDFRPLTLKDIYDRVERIKLHEGVPIAIREQFETARNLYIYSWFYYPFNVSAQLHAFASAEYALKTKANVNPISFKRMPGFKQLLKMAVDKGWIIDEGFSHIQPASFQAIDDELPDHSEQKRLDTYCKALIDTLPLLRNELAHGSNMLDNHGAHYLLICAELINQLFEPSDSKG